ncbi:acyl carrier protein [Cohnella lubricantis]|uniref:Acyl carrier protein n=1 Tax=Cohnella lubricantis TaxID=2163172 RepID=A0A841TA70_9BACL|nr:acyl carrier protein [Cohnella lubricantis]MBB6676298.1 acyl carrier protein [Cohnella lubricantis]MBP2119632.1 acyl carrier protein [Cohnella lubricantis]
MPEQWSKEQIEEKVKQLVHEQLRVEPADIRDDADFVDDYGADSLDLTELVISLEDEFSVRVPESEMKRLNSVGAVVGFLAEQQSK